MNVKNENVFKPLAVSTILRQSAGPHHILNSTSTASGIVCASRWHRAVRGTVITHRLRYGCSPAILTSCDNKEQIRVVFLHSEGS